MTWTRLSDNFTDQPSMLEVSRSARLLHIEALVWCNRMETDGKLPSAAIRRLTDAEDIPDLIGELATAGLWEGAQDCDSWHLDWSEQEPAAEVQARRAYRATTQKKYRDRKARHERDDHSLCDLRFCKKAVTGNESSNESSNKNGYETPSRPVPSRPQGRDRGKGAGPGSAGATPARATEESWAYHQQVELAHQFLADDDGRCTAGWVENADTWVCGQHKSDASHGHAYQPGGGVCDYCSQSRDHLIHRNGLGQ